MEVWVTGAGGFLGDYLVEMLLGKGYQVLATYYRPTTSLDKINKKARVEECDIRDRRRVRELLWDFKATKIFHLAAQSLPTVSWDEPWYTLETNVIGTVNVFEAIRGLKLESRVLNACSSGQYGFVTENEVPVKEDHNFKPLHPYGVSKAAQEMLAYQYWTNFGIESISVRIFNTTGPRKVNDVCSDLTRRLVDIEKGTNHQRELRVGNLRTKRAITDVRDAIRAFDLVLENGTVGESYNLSGETAYSVLEIVDILRKLVHFDFDIREDPELIRPTDEPIIYGSSEKLRRQTGWKQEIALEDTLRDMLDYWRGNL